MTEEVKPKGTPYGQAMALLQEFAESLPAAVVILPDHVLWPSNSQGLSVQTFQLLDQAAAVLSAVHARHIPVALLIASDTAKVVRSCLEATSVLAQQFAAVVEYEVQSENQQQEQQQPQQADTNSSWMAAAGAVKAATGVPWQQMLMFCPAETLAAARLANKLGMACVRVPAATGLDVSSLRNGLELYRSKLESDRGY